MSSIDTADAMVEQIRHAEDDDAWYALVADIKATYAGIQAQLSEKDALIARLTQQANEGVELGNAEEAVPDAEEAAPDAEEAAPGADDAPPAEDGGSSDALAAPVAPAAASPSGTAGWPLQHSSGTEGGRTSAWPVSGAKAAPAGPPSLAPAVVPAAGAQISPQQIKENNAAKRKAIAALHKEIAEDNEAFVKSSPARAAQAKKQKKIELCNGKVEKATTRVSGIEAKLAALRGSPDSGVLGAEIGKVESELAVATSKLREMRQEAAQAQFDSTE